MTTVVKAKPDETADSLIRRFKKKVMQYRILLEVKRREFYIKPSEERKEKKNELERKKKRERLWG